MLQWMLSSLIHRVNFVATSAAMHYVKKSIDDVGVVGVSYFPYERTFEVRKITICLRGKPDKHNSQNSLLMNIWYKYSSKTNKSDSDSARGGKLGHQSSSLSILRGADDAVKKFPDDPDGWELCKEIFLWSLIQVSRLKHTIDQSRGNCSFCLITNEEAKRGVNETLSNLGTSDHLSTQMWEHLLHFWDKKWSSFFPIWTNSDKFQLDIEILKIRFCVTKHSWTNNWTHK